jgi:hypothetical protein
VISVDAGPHPAGEAAGARDVPEVRAGVARAGVRKEQTHGRRVRNLARQHTQGNLTSINAFGLLFIYFIRQINSFINNITF